MAEQLGDWKRTHTCGELRTEDLGKDATLLGWVHRVRDLGGVLFIDIRDREGISQIVVRDDEKLLAQAKRFRPEFVIAHVPSYAKLRVEGHSGQRAIPSLHGCAAL